MRVLSVYRKRESQLHVTRAIYFARSAYTRILVGCFSRWHPARRFLIADSVTQLGDIKRQKVRLEALKREAEEERQRAREAARERVLLEFEKGQLGLAGRPSTATTSGADSKERQSCSFVTPRSDSMNALQLEEPSGNFPSIRQPWTTSRRKQKMPRSNKSSVNKPRLSRTSSQTSGSLPSLRHMHLLDRLRPFQISSYKRRVVEESQAIILREYIHGRTL